MIENEESFEKSIFIERNSELIENKKMIMKLIIK